jgi:cell division septation protein DedD
MKDEQASEEKLMGELELMYRHVAGLESDQVDDEPHNAPKIIPFPGNNPDSRSWKPSEASEGELRPERKPFARIYLIVASFSVVFLASVAVLVILDMITGPRGSEKREWREATAPIQLKPSPPVQKQEKMVQPVEERQLQAETTPQETVESNTPPQQTAEPELEPEPPPTKTKHYAVQLGVFSSWKNASRRISRLRKENLEPYWVAKPSRDKGTVYVIYSGSFTNRREAVRFMKGKDIRKNYPDSFVRGISLQRG